MEKFLCTGSFCQGFVHLAQNGVFTFASKRVFNKRIRRLQVKRKVLLTNYNPASNIDATGLTRVSGNTCLTLIFVRKIFVLATVTASFAEKEIFYIFSKGIQVRLFELAYNF